MDLGGAPEDYDIGGEKVFKKSDPSKSLTYAAAAQRAIELGGKFDGHEPPADVNPMTAASVKNARGHGPRRLGEGQPAAHRAAGGVRRELLPDRARHETGAVRHRRLPRGRRLRHRDPSDGSRDADQRRRGRWASASRRSSTTSTTRRTACRGTVSLYQAKPATYLDVAQNVPHRRGRQARSAEPARHEGHRRARDGRRRVGVAVRDLGCARRPLLQPSARHARSDRQRARRPPQSHKPLQVNTA